MTSKPSTDSKPNMTNYNKAVRTAKSASTKAGQAMWIIGDAALTVVTEYKENKLGQFADDISVEIATVRSYRTMAAKYPANEISRDLQSPTVYSIFVSQDDAFKLVRQANDDKTPYIWTVSAARALVKSRKDALNPPAVIDPDGDPEDGGKSGDVDPRAKLVSEVARLSAELVKAQTALELYDAEHPAEPVAPAEVQHVIKGIPAHAASEPRTDCDICKKSGVTPMPAPRKSRNRKTPVAA